MDEKYFRLLPMALVLVVAIVFGGGAKSRAGAPQTGIDAPPITRMKTKDSERPLKKFVRGPATHPGGDFSAWLDGHIRTGGRRELRVPMILKRGDVGISLRGARIGSAADAIEVHANDSALGIGLADRARTHCIDRSTCAFWVEGRVRQEESAELRFDVFRIHSPIAPDALAAANYIEVEALTIPEPAEPEQRFPLPKGARKNDALGGATSIAPGRNYSMKVYEIDSDFEAISTFYERHLPDAQRSTNADAIVFSTPRGKVKVTRISKGTRIILTIGPQ